MAAFRIRLDHNRDYIHTRTRDRVDGSQRRFLSVFSPPSHTYILSLRYRWCMGRVVLRHGWIPRRACRVSTLYARIVSLLNS